MLADLRTVYEEQRDSIQHLNDKKQTHLKIITNTQYQDIFNVKLIITRQDLYAGWCWKTVSFIW